MVSLKVKIKRDFQSAKKACCRLLKVRSRSEKELRDRLRLNGFDSATVDQTILELTNSGLVDDEAFARLWVESRIKKPLGVHRLVTELEIKGINKRIIAEVLSEYTSPQHEEATIRQMLELKLKKLKGLHKEKIRERLWGFFLRKGFSKEVVFDVLNEL